MSDHRATQALLKQWLQAAEEFKQCHSSFYAFAKKTGHSLWNIEALVTDADERIQLKFCRSQLWSSLAAAENTLVSCKILTRKQGVHDFIKPEEIDMLDRALLYRDYSDAHDPASNFLEATDLLFELCATYAVAERQTLAVKKEEFRQEVRGRRIWPEGFLP